MSTASGRNRELALLARIRKRAAMQPAPNLRLGIGDDCALLRLGSNQELAVTTDLNIAGRHFQLDLHPPESIGHRTLARGLSDLAAMGARPVAAFLSLGLPRQLAGKWLDRFFDGFFALANEHKVPLAGGDLAESPVAVADIVLTGAVPHSKALLRSGARPGHLLYVTGNLGGAAAGLAQLKKLAAVQTARGRRAAQPKPGKIPSALRGKLAPHLFPQPRLAQGLWLMRRGLASAAIDISDGLSTDLAHLCDESGVGVKLLAASLPIHSGATLEQALHGGEDYELLFTAPPSASIPRRIAGVPVTRIGRITRAYAGVHQVLLLTRKGYEQVAPRGWQHFS
ncbi:MAG: thiamine-phosphate kinase [Terracidiphilus sp.]